MPFERDLLISLLKTTNKGPVNLEKLKIEAKLPSAVCLQLLQNLQYSNLVYLNGDVVEVEDDRRLKLAVRAAELGLDIERLSEVLRWQEFEGISAIALDLNGFVVKKNVRIKHEGKRWEIDVVGCRKPFVFCVDCKHWHHGLRLSALKLMVESQVKRVEAFADALQNASLQMECARWSKARVVPIIVSLLPAAYKFVDDVPIVPVLQLQDFINQLPAYSESIKCFSVRLSHL